MFPVPRIAGEAPVAGDGYSASLAEGVDRAVRADRSRGQAKTVNLAAGYGESPGAGSEATCRGYECPGTVISSRPAFSTAGSLRRWDGNQQRSQR
jgi:hypothetical protein